MVWDKACFFFHKKGLPVSHLTPCPRYVKNNTNKRFLSQTRHIHKVLSRSFCNSVSVVLGLLDTFCSRPSIKCKGHSVLGNATVVLQRLMTAFTTFHETSNALEVLPYPSGQLKVIRKAQLQQSDKTKKTSRKVHQSNTSLTSGI